MGGYVLKIFIIRKRGVINLFAIIIGLIIIFSLIRHYHYKAIATFLPKLPKTIVLDPGHGGIDPGAVSKSGVKEKDINLAITFYLKDYLEESGAKVILTRSRDEGLYSSSGSLSQKKTEDLKKRKEIIKKSDADLFVTIHLNSFPQAKYYGAQTFYSKDNESGKILAECIQEELIKTLDNENKRTILSKDDVYIIKGLDIPTALVECGFLSNPNEEKLLQKSTYQKKIAWAIYLGIQKYFTLYP